MCTRLLSVSIPVFLLSCAASAADRLVPQSYSSIQSAINASVNGDRVLVSPGVYPESINFNGKRITVQSSGGPTVTVIDASGLNRRVVQFTGGENSLSVLDGFTIRGGNPTTGTLVGHGGGILCCSSSQPTILNCVVRDNVAELGGGIYMCLNSSQTRIGNTAFCNNLCGSGYGFDIAQGFVDLGGVTACADCGCDPGPIVEWTTPQGGNGHWYQARMQPGWIDWESARSDAVARGGQLVSLTGAAEQQFVQSLLRPYSIAYWIGLSQQSGGSEPGGGWNWSDGSALQYLNWGAGLPDNGNGNQHFGAIRLGGTWDDFRVDGETYSNRLGIRGWLIEWSADCNSDGIVDYGQIRSGTLGDVNGNNVPDVCEAGVDCNLNGLLDVDEIQSGRAFDEDRDGEIDSCTSQDPLPVVRSIGINRGPGCGWWTTALFPEIWDLWVSRVSPEGPWLNGSLVAGGSLRLEAELQPGLNTLSIRHEFNGCKSSVWGLGLWLENSLAPQIRIAPGDPCIAYDGLINSTLNQSGTTGGGTTTARFGRWNITALSLSMVSAGDLVGEITLAPSGTPDIVTTVQLSVTPICRGDVNESGIVNGVDLAAILSVWGTDGGKFPLADVDGDGIVGGADLTIVLSDWGTCP